MARIDRPASWVIVDLATGVAVLETFSADPGIPEHAKYGHCHQPEDTMYALTIVTQIGTITIIRIPAGSERQAANRLRRRVRFSAILKIVKIDEKTV